GGGGRRPPPGARDAAVVAREDAAGDRRLVAYVVADGGADAAELRGFLSGRLPEYMVPSAFVALDALPLTPTGKLDRRALPAPEAASVEVRTPYTGPRTPLEATLAGMWASVLGVERVGVHDDFFELGGHSLHAVRVGTRVREAFGVGLDLRQFFDAPTVAGLAALLVASGVVSGPDEAATPEDEAAVMAVLGSIPVDELDRLLDRIAGEDGEEW
ncbi:MAG: phosphopantetheine-binding protein, partial [Gemmatimonadota bacterium]